MMILTPYKFAMVILLAGLAGDVVLANIPGPIPTEKAIFNAEHDPAFLSVITRVINGSAVNGQYYYMGYSNNPARDFFCVNNLYHIGLRYLNPFHHYTTTTLAFAVTFQTRPEPPYTLYGLLLLLQVDPTTGQVYNVRQSQPCIGPPPPP